MSMRPVRSQSERRNLTKFYDDPFCQTAQRKQFDKELDEIRAQSRFIWSRPDTSLTTHGHFFANPEQTERTPSRPTSAGRRHNPHPKLVFMRTGMKEIPNAYGAPATSFDQHQETKNQNESVPDYFQQIQDLTPDEQHGVNAFLKSANYDSKKNVVEALKKYRIFMKNQYECPPIGAMSDGRTEIYPSMERFRQAIRNDREFSAINAALENPETEIKLTENQYPQSAPRAIIKENVHRLNNKKTHFQRENHSHSQCPWPLARRPYRGDFSIHYDWHPRLPHHRLTCLC